MLKHHPDYWDFDTLEIELLKSDNTQQITQWRLTELYIGGRLIPEIRFKTCLVNGLAGIVIQRTEGTSSPAPLLRWPNAFANSEELPCIPTRGASTLGSNAALSGLGTSDWDTLQHLTKQLAGFLAQPTDGRIPRKLNTAALRNGLLAFAKTLAKWPRMLRYDSIQLQETLRNQGYERLGISLGNLRLDHHLWPAFDYRLATVDRGPHSFGQNPRLEFPDGSARGVLQHWFEESGDNNNPRLELRFAQPNAMDTRVWGMLSPNDQQLIGALIKTLPLQLEDLKQANPAASRPWQDWQALAGMLRDTLRDNLIRSTAPAEAPQKSRNDDGRNTFYRQQANAYPATDRQPSAGTFPTSVGHSHRCQPKQSKLARLAGHPARKRPADRCQSGSAGRRQAKRRSGLGLADAPCGTRRKPR
ncbi:hypothetical protein ACE0DR_24820 [Azotobacter sp. CWF10]